MSPKKFLYKIETNEKIFFLIIYFMIFSCDENRQMKNLTKLKARLFESNGINRMDADKHNLEVVLLMSHRFLDPLVSNHVV